MEYEFHKIRSQLAVLRDVVAEYPTSSLPNVIQQLQARLDNLSSKN